ncbi:arabinose efflux permease family protein [Terriglobus roseus DSM 18391]|uniref:Arabinose efflux permease family protein n=1 Tax=Terriglobus roseus (strain DSM 18391 / NRRL B-41598 / KBS 63) TaxID=926566 RepID=I3ZE49_TERRK|nr:MFS transporter [Terriglobus roseus]AFL87517.1 arabinose efflux permease family protein [Terriglobus roseus DSM 18391]
MLAATPPRTKTSAIYPVLGGASLGHMLNDMLQSLFIASYPMFKGNFHLSFGQIGILTLVFQITASLLQPLVGLYTDRRPMPYSLAFGMSISMCGLLALAFAPSFGFLLLGGAMLGIGSSIFHPESSRLARMASGGAHGMAQSIFQVGGNFGASLGPLFVAFVVLPHGQRSLAWFSLAALLGIVLLSALGTWYKRQNANAPKKHAVSTKSSLSRKQVGGAIGVLILLTLSKYFYLASITSYYVFYLMQHFHATQRNAQLCLFVFLGAVAVGTVVGGPVGDRIGRKKVIWVSILGVLPLTLLLPYVALPVTIGLSVVIGLVIASAFSAILVYAQELLPGRVGMVSGLFFGLAFGLGGLGAALLGNLADHTSIDFVYKVCSFLPALGLLTGFLPDTGKHNVEGNVDPQVDAQQPLAVIQ